MMPTVCTESHVIVGRAGDIKLKWFAKDFFVAVCRWVQQENSIALVDREAINDNILGGGRFMFRTGVAQRNISSIALGNSERSFFNIVS